MNNSDLNQSLITRGVLKSGSLINAFKNVDRVDFVPFELQSMAYEDRPLPIGLSQTISQPYTVAFMLELLQPGHGDHVMDLGSGSGWTTALLASVCEHVDAVERIEALLDFSKENLSKYAFNNISLHRAESTFGLEGHSFDKILVSCAADEIPKSLLEQLRTGGDMVIPIGHSIMKVKKIGENKLQVQEYPGFVFVPLISDE
jgi:protein-L-isoaspartate(D-aspartate) O-methyltransferase